MLGFITSGIMMISTALLGTGSKGAIKREKPVQHAPVVKAQVVPIKCYDKAILFNYCRRDNTEGPVCEECKTKNKPTASPPRILPLEESSPAQPPIFYTNNNSAQKKPPPKKLYHFKEKIPFQEVIRSIYHPPSK